MKNNFTTKESNKIEIKTKDKLSEYDKNEIKTKDKLSEYDKNEIKTENKLSKKSKRKSTIFVESEIDLKFRKIAASKFNFSQGWYTKTVNEAFKEWVDRNEEYFKLD